MRQFRPLVSLGLLLAATFAQAESPTLFSTDFETGNLTDWKCHDPDSWRIGTVGENKVLELFQPSKYRPKVRSPYGLALLDTVTVADFELTCRVKSTTKSYNHRDLCLFFGYQDPQHFYYVHFGRRSDPHSNSIFLVNNAPRVSIAKTRTTGTNWTDDWHTVRVKRVLDIGLIEVYFDDLEKPAMTAQDKTFGPGKIGLGSFDDTGLFDNLELKGTKP